MSVSSMRVVGAVLAVASLVLVGCGTPDPAPSGGAQPSAAAGTGVVRIAAASDLKFALADVEKAMEQANPGLDVRVTAGSSGTFFQQLQNGAPFDLYLSADIDYPNKLRDAGLVEPQDVFPYAVGRLVVWSANASPVDPARGILSLTDPAAKRVSIANPDHAPYGKAAVAAMRTAGVYDAVAPKFVLGENIAQAGEFVATGNAQVGVIALSLALAPQYTEKGRYTEVPLDSFPQLLQGGAVLKNAADPEAARKVRDFMTGPDGHTILKRYGFYLPGS